MLQQAAAKKAAAKQAADQKAAAKQAAAKQAADQKAADQKAADQKAAAQQLAAQQAELDKRVPAIQDFPQGPVQKPTKISDIYVPSPSFAVVGLANDMKNSATCDDSCDFDKGSDLLLVYEWMRGAELGILAGRKGFTPNMDSYLNREDAYNFAFHLGFLLGIMATDCDPDMYVVLYKKLLKMLEENEEKRKKRAINQFDPCAPSGGGGRGGVSGGGGGPPC